MENCTNCHAEDLEGDGRAPGHSQTGWVRLPDGGQQQDRRACGHDHHSPWQRAQVGAVLPSLWQAMQSSISPKRRCIFP